MSRRPMARPHHIEGWRGGASGGPGRRACTDVSVPEGTRVSLFRNRRFLRLKRQNSGSVLWIKEDGTDSRLVAQLPTAYVGSERPINEAPRPQHRQCLWPPDPSILVECRGLQPR